MSKKSAKIDVHNYDGRVEAAIRRVKADSRILPSNKKAILSYVPELVAKGLTAPRVAKYLTNLPNIAIWLGKDFKKATRDGITRVLNELVKRPYSPWTVQGYKVILKKFYQWLYRCEDKEYPKHVKHVKTSLKSRDHKLPEFQHGSDICTIKSARSGEHSLKVTKTNYTEYTTTVKIPPEQTINAILTKK